MILNEIYAMCCWNYYEWLHEFEKSQKEEESPKKETENSLVKADRKSEKEDVFKEVPVNPEPGIFKDGYAYKMFMELKELMVRKKTALADYSYIFYKMHNGPVYTIKELTSHTKFINYINKEYDAGITASKFTCRENSARHKIYSTVNGNYEIFYKR